MSAQPTIQHKPLIHGLPVSYEQICDLETALALAKAYLKSTHATDGLIAEKAAKFDALYTHVSDFNKSHRWTEIVFPPEIEKILGKHKDGAKPT